MTNIELLDKGDGTQFRVVCVVCGAPADTGEPKVLTLGDSADSVWLTGVVGVCKLHRPGTGYFHDALRRVAVLYHHVHSGTAVVTGGQE